MYIIEKEENWDKSYILCVKVQIWFTWYIDTNYSIKVEVSDIQKNDELYLMWWPENSTDYVELDNITDYYLEITG